MTKKTDNKNLPAKLALRRWLIGEAGLGELRVLDLCAGKGMIWNHLRKEFKVKSYTPCDRKPRQPGSIPGEADVLLKAFDLTKFNVIDVDTYGEPWAAWSYLAGRIKEPTAVFLTCGIVAGQGGCNLSKESREAIGIPATWPIPQKKSLAAFAGEYILATGANRCQVLRAGRMVLPNVRYYALHVAGHK